MKIFRWMDLACDITSRWLYRPVRGICLRWCGLQNVELLEGVASATSTASSSQMSGLGWPFDAPRSVPEQDEGTRIRSRLLGRLLERPLLGTRAARMAAHMAAQAAQV